MSMLFRVFRVLHALPCPSCPSVPFRASRVFPVHVHVFILAPEPRPALDAPSTLRRHIFILAPSGLSLYTSMSFVLFRVLLVSFVFFSCPCAFGASRVFSCLLVSSVLYTFPMGRQPHLLSSKREAGYLDARNFHISPQEGTGPVIRCQRTQG